MSPTRLETLLPHRPPMLLLDALVEHGEDWAVCEACPRPDQLFATADGMPAIVCVEYMAQTVGALAGLRERERGRSPRIGYLIGAREVVLHVDTLGFGQPLRVRVRNIWTDNTGRAGQFACTVGRGAARVADGVLTVYQPPSADEAVP